MIFLKKRMLKINKKEGLDKFFCSSLNQFIFKDDIEIMFDWETQSDIKCENIIVKNLNCNNIKGNSIKGLNIICNNFNFKNIQIVDIECSSLYGENIKIIKKGE